MNNTVSSPRFVDCISICMPKLENLCSIHCNSSHLVFSVGGNSGGGDGKGKRKQNVVPVQIEELLNSPEEGFTVEGSEVGMVIIAGKVIHCEKATTKTSYRVRRL